MPIAFQNGTTATVNGAGTVVINVPASVANGDMLVLGVAVGEAVGVVPTVPGFTQKALHNGAQDGDPPYSTDLTSALFYRRASSEPASYTVTLDATYGLTGAVSMLRYTGVIATGDPFRTSATVSRTNTSATTYTSVALTGVQASDLALHMCGCAMPSWNTNAYDLAGPGGGWVERGEVYMTTASTAKPGILFVEQLGTGTAPVITTSGTATPGNARPVFVAGALMEEPAGGGGSKIYQTAVRRASTW
jgi:hypothetical protein